MFAFYWHPRVCTEYKAFFQILVNKDQVAGFIEIHSNTFFKRPKLKSPLCNLFLDGFATYLDREADLLENHKILHHIFIFLR